MTVFTVRVFSPGVASIPAPATLEPPTPKSFPFTMKIQHYRVSHTFKWMDLNLTPDRLNLTDIPLNLTPDRLTD